MKTLAAQKTEQKYGVPIWLDDAAQEPQSSAKAETSWNVGQNAGKMARNSAHRMTTPNAARNRPKSLRAASSTASLTLLSE